MDFDFKITAWERVTIPEEKHSDVCAAIKTGKIQSVNDVYDYLDYMDSLSTEIMIDTVESMVLSDNEYFSTIEVSHLGEVYYSNGKN